MTDRAVVTVYCRGKRGKRGSSHRLARLLATSDGLHVHIPHTAVGHAKDGRVVNRLGGPLVVPLLDPDPDLAMAWTAMCAEGVHSIWATDLARAASAGIKVIVLDPILR